MTYEAGRGPIEQRPVPTPRLKCSSRQPANGAGTSFSMWRWLIKGTLAGATREGGGRDKRRHHPKSRSRIGPHKVEASLDHIGGCRSFSVRYIIQVSLIIFIRET
jgi:hypothetical protein